MSEIPEEEIWTQVENLKCSLDKCPSKEGEEIWRDAVRWAERFWWDANKDGWPTQNGEYLAPHYGHWSFARFCNGIWHFEDGETRHIMDVPQYKPMPPEPEDEQ